MIAYLVSIGLSILIGTTVEAWALPVVLHFVAIRNWLYVAIGSEEGRAHREEMQADLRDEITEHRLGGDSNKVIAVKIFLRLVRGLPDDIGRCAPFVPAWLAAKTAVWSDKLRHYRVPDAMVAGVVSFGFMNYSVFSSHNHRTFVTWLLANGSAVAMTVLVWKMKNPKVRRIFHLWMGTAIVAALAAVLWLIFDYHLYANPTFRVFMLAVLAMSPLMIAVDKSWRNRLFRGRWWLLVVSWALLIGGALVGSWIMVHDVKPLLEAWALMALFAVVLLVVYGGLALAAFVLCWLGIRGSASGLRLAASGLRHLD